MKSKKLVKIDSGKVRAAIAEMGKPMSVVSYELGVSSCYMSRACVNGEMSETVFNLFCLLYDLNCNDFIAHEEQTNNAASDQQEGYHMRLSVTPTIVTVTAMFGNEVMYIGRSKVKGNSELDLMQAISYATHMIYKASEQKALADRVSGDIHV